MLLQHRGDDGEEDIHFPSPEMPTSALLGIDGQPDGTQQDAAIQRTLSKAKEAAVRCLLCPLFMPDMIMLHSEHDRKISWTLPDITWALRSPGIDEILEEGRA